MAGTTLAIAKLGDEIDEEGEVRESVMRGVVVVLQGIYRRNAENDEQGIKRRKPRRERTSALLPSHSCRLPRARPGRLSLAIVQDARTAGDADSGGLQVYQRRWLRGWRLARLHLLGQRSRAPPQWTALKLKDGGGDDESALASSGRLNHDGYAFLALLLATTVHTSCCTKFSMPHTPASSVWNLKGCNERHAV